MKALLVYDSVFGNTEKVAMAIGKALNSRVNTEICKVGEYKPEQFKDVQMLVVGSPTRAFKPTKPIMDFLNNIPNKTLKGVKVSSFDTRISIKEVNSRFLYFMIRIFGYAAKPIADRLKKKGGYLIVSPEGFFVKDSEGPLKDGELERAAEWGFRLSEVILQ